MSEPLLNELAKQRGLGEAYYDHCGELRYFSTVARRAILQAMGVPVENEAAMNASLQSNSHLAPAFDCAQSDVSTCFQPRSLVDAKQWGLSIQLYAMRSNNNWGIGDFDDLREVIDLAAPLGCDLIGLSPLHALFPANPSHVSPYSPSSRLFLNALYIAVPALPEFSECEAACKWFSQDDVQAELAFVRESRTVLYARVASLKVQALRLLYAHFCKASVNTERVAEFYAYVEERGNALYLHACFDALDAYFRKQPLALCGWQQWPLPYRDPYSAAVKEFAAEYSDEIKFYQFLQWVADTQFKVAQAHARTQGMKIGLYGDLAVGADPSGAEVWSNQALYVTQAAVGAPPDPLALKGQDWGIPPIDPYVLRQQNLQPFIELVRANMRNVGALRIDHVMSLFRLWWVPKGFTAVDGVYVHYPLEQLMNALAVESTRAGCLVIGEDLGTVPDEIRQAMSQYQLFHYKVLLFEKQSDGSFRSPSDYERLAIATVTTHDLPPFKSWWQGDDLDLRDRLHLYPTPETAQHLRVKRESDRLALSGALNEANLWHWQANTAVPEYSLALARAVHLYLGLSQAALVLVQLEDVIGMTEPVNVPGTNTEYANWQRKIEMTTADIFTRDDLVDTMVSLSKARAGVDPNS